MEAKRLLLNRNQPTTVKLNDSISCRLYEDTRPHYLETSHIQKGLVLLVDGEEVVEEGVGFGTPVVICRDRPFFSGSAKTSFHQEKDYSKLTKSFTMDTISKKKFRRSFYLNDIVYRFVQRRFYNVYTLNNTLASALTPIIELMKSAGIETDFQKVNSIGSVSVEYTCFPGSIEIEARFCGLNKKGCSQVLILNEQGASFFRRYLDANGVSLQDNQIGPWEPTGAGEVSLFNVQETTGFSLKSKEDAKLFRGREKIRNRYSWVGFCYSLPPDTSTFQYVIKLMTKIERNATAKTNS